MACTESCMVVGNCGGLLWVVFVPFVVSLLNCKPLQHTVEGPRRLVTEKIAHCGRGGWILCVLGSYPLSLNPSYFLLRPTAARYSWYRSVETHRPSLCRGKVFYHSFGKLPDVSHPPRSSMQSISWLHQHQ